MLDACSWVIVAVELQDERCSLRTCVTRLHCTCSHLFGSHIHAFVFVTLFGAECGDISAKLLCLGGQAMELHLC